jgi:hypothetical protein
VESSTHDPKGGGARQPGATSEEFIINADDFRLVEIQVVRSDARAKERYSYQLDIENSRVPLDSEFVLADQVD